MLICVADVLSKETVAPLRGVMDAAQWEDGASAAGAQPCSAREVKLSAGDVALYSSISLHLPQGDARCARRILHLASEHELQQYGTFVAS